MLRQSLLCIVVAVPAAVHAHVQFTITDIPPLGGAASYAAGVNASGSVVGSAYTTNSATNQSFLYTKAGGVMAVGELVGTSNSAATGINASGAIVGYSPVDMANTKRHAYLRPAGSAMLTDLGTLGGNQSFAYAINDSGKIVGQSEVNATVSHAFVYQQGMGLTDLGVIGGNTSAAAAINATGMIVGSSTTGSSTVPCIFQGAGLVTSLGTLGGNYGNATGVNNVGTIVGSSNLAGNMVARAFIYTASTGIRNLGTLGGANVTSGATAINNHGEIVGGLSDPVTFPATSHAFLYVAGKMKDLDTLVDPAAGWKFETATAINDKHQITGYGQFNDQRHSFLLTPIPARVVVKGKKALVTNRRRYILHGTTAGYVTGVSCRVGPKGKAQKLGKIDNWKFAAQLKKGRNVVVITAESPAGKASRKVVVKREG